MALLRGILLLAATLTTGLTAGFFYAFSHDVMPGLGRTDDRTFVGAFQGLDKQVYNPWFMGAYLGALVLTVAAAATHLGSGDTGVLAWIVAALVLAIATFAITGIVHVPMNNDLQALGPPDQMADLHRVREGFEARWVRWNIVRTGTSVGSFASLCWALVLYGRS